ncbi:unnamed protein product [Lupinus luteus]|uniref:10 kDa chaperonin n=1 Tax=Lupinus luteus TaxID=3873 RepID=A0AAV1XPQ8_LUPLU
MEKVSESKEEKGMGKEKWQRREWNGKVIATSPGTHNKDGKLIHVSVKEGDIVLLPEYGGPKVKLGDKEYV